MRRPPATVLPDGALVPAANLISPPPTTFTHVLSARQPFFLASSAAQGQPDGFIEAGTKVVLLARDADRCRVVDGRGLYVETGCEGLRRLD